jgi:2'-5' RNA ligase
LALARTHGLTTVAEVWFVGAPASFAGDPGDVVPSTTDLRATRPADRHITLVFLGRVPDDVVSRCWAGLPPVVLPREVRPLRWERFGRSAIALVVSDDDGLLRAAADACRGATASVVEVHPPSEHRPHVTMARVPRRARPPTAKALRGWAVPSGPLDVGGLTLFRSRAGGSGDRYAVVAQRE